LSFNLQANGKEADRAVLGPVVPKVGISYFFVISKLLSYMASFPKFSH